MFCASALRVICVLVLLPFLTGCSTMYGRQNDIANIFFSSNQEGTSVTCSGESIQTPGNLALKQSVGHRCTASLEGFETEVFKVRSWPSRKGFAYSTEVNWAKWGIWTLGIGVVIGWVVDFASGAMRDLGHDRYDITLKPAGSVSTAQKIVGKTVGVTKALVELPRDLASETTTVVLDTTVRTSSEGIGVASKQKRKAVEGELGGKKIMEYYEEN